MHELTFKDQLLHHPESLPMTQTVKVSFPDRSLTVHYLREAYVLGSGYVRQSCYPDSRNLHAGDGGLLTANLEVFPESYLRQDHIASLPEKYFKYCKCTGQLILKQTPEPSKRLLGTYYCLGNLLSHFGHFLLDGLPYLWYLLQLPESYRHTLKYLYLGNGIPEWGWDLLIPLGIQPHKVIRSVSCARVNALIVPSASYETHIASHSAFQAVLDVIRTYHAKDIQPTRKLYLSRRQQPSRTLTNQLEVEQVFIQHGYQVVIPENLSLVEQIRLASSASHLAGPVGSNMYLAGFQHSGTTTIILKPQHYSLPDDRLLAEQGHRHCIELEGSPLDRETYLPGQWRYPVTPQLYSLLST